MNKNYMIIIAIVGLFLIGVVSLLSVFLTEDIIIHEMDVYIAGDDVGAFNLNPDKLHFGKVAEDSPRGYRELDLINYKEYPLKFKLTASGEMGDWVYYKLDGKFYYGSYTVTVPAGETHTVRVQIDGSEYDVAEGDYYTGELKVKVSRALF